jgi:WD40 repeat protein
MVVRLIIGLMLPPDRGLVIRDESDQGIEDTRAWYKSPTYYRRPYRHRPDHPLIEISGNSDSSPSTLTQQEKRVAPSSHLYLRPKTRAKRKPFRALAVLTSAASDLDVISDWVFFFQSYRNYNEYHEKYKENPSEGVEPYLFPHCLLRTLTVVCVAATIMYLVVATEGRLIAPILRHWGIDKMSMGYALFFAVLIEDIPQVVLTFMIEDYYEENQSINNFALVNVITSLYDTLIKIAESFDERSDLVETGVWCKQSIWAHNGPVSMVLPLPVPEEDSESSSIHKEAISSHTLPKSCWRRGVGGRGLGKKGSSRMHLQPQPRNEKTPHQSLLDRAVEVVAVAQLPRHRLLSASLDKSVRLWDIPSTSQSQSIFNNKRKFCKRSYKGHDDEVTCLAFLGKKTVDRCLEENSVDCDVEFFLTGSRDAKVRLWNLETGACLRRYYTLHETRSSYNVTSIASVRKWETFVCGYNDGVARLWDLASGLCLSEYCGHGGSIKSVCSLEDSTHFLSGSDDASIRLWQGGNGAMQNAGSSLSFDGSIVLEQVADSTTRMDLMNPKQVNVRSSLAGGSKGRVSVKTYVGHTGPVYSIACVEPAMAFLSGSEDRTARLWSVESGICLRIFSGHTEAVTTVAVVDQVTFLTGSQDCTVKVWDAFTGQSLRTYSGHSGAVTSVYVAQDGTFVSSSVDQTIKLWVFTAVARSISEDNSAELNDNPCNVMVSSHP